MEELATGRKEAALKIGQQLLLLQADTVPETWGRLGENEPLLIPEFLTTGPQSALWADQMSELEAPVPF